MQTSKTVITTTLLNRKLNSAAGIAASFALLVLASGYSIYLNDLHNATKWMPASLHSIYIDHEFWRAWTTLFVHAHIAHFLSNSLLFFILGYFLIGYFGFFLFPVLAFIFGGITNLIVLKSMPETVQLIGASGVVYWMGAVWLTLYFLIDKRRSLFQRSIRTFGTGLGLFMPAEAFDPSISYETHLVGFCIGLICGLLFYMYHRKDFEAAIVREQIEEEIEVVTQ